MFENMKNQEMAGAQGVIGGGMQLGVGQSATKREQTIREAIDERIRSLTQEIKRSEDLKRGMSEDLLGMPVSFLRGRY
jgi:hypothetical protein